LCDPKYQKVVLHLLSCVNWYINITLLMLVKSTLADDFMFHSSPVSADFKRLRMTVQRP